MSVWFLTACPKPSNFVQCSIFFLQHVCIYSIFFREKLNCPSFIVLFFCFCFLIIPRCHQLRVTDVAQAFGTFFPCLIAFSLSCPPTVSLFHLKSRPYPFHTSYFLKGRTLSSAPYLTKLVSVSYRLPFFHPRLSQCITTPRFALLILFQN